MNRVILIGRLTKQPELKSTANGISVCQFTIAVNRTYKTEGREQQADFINCVVWRNQAENLAKYMHKGNQIGVDGRLQVRNYEDAGGVKRYVTEVICDQIHFLEPKGSRDNGFNDINNYDIPSGQSNEYNDSFGNYATGRQDNNNSSNNDIEDPFANLKTSSGISDDDLPF